MELIGHMIHYMQKRRYSQKIKNKKIKNQEQNQLTISSWTILGGRGLV